MKDEAVLVPSLGISLFNEETRNRKKNKKVLVPSLGISLFNGKYESENMESLVLVPSLGISLFNHIRLLLQFDAFPLFSSPLWGFLYLMN